MSSMHPPCHVKQRHQCGWEEVSGTSKKRFNAMKRSSLHQKQLPNNKVGELSKSTRGILVESTKCRKSVVGRFCSSLSHLLVTVSSYISAQEYMMETYNCLGLGCHVHPLYPCHCLFCLSASILRLHVFGVMLSHH